MAVWVCATGEKAGCSLTQWCESQKACGRLKLADLLVKPLQRLTKYKLLLYAVKSPLDKMLTTDVIVADRIAAVDTAVSIGDATSTSQLSLSPHRYDHLYSPNNGSITKPGIERVRACTRGHFAFAAMLSCAPIANPPNSAQVAGTPYHSSKLHPGP